MGDFWRFVAVCVNDYKPDAASVLEHLIPLCCKHFGAEVKKWLTPDSWRENAHRSYNQQTQKIEEDIALVNNNWALLVAYFGDNLDYYK